MKKEPKTQMTGVKAYMGEPLEKEIKRALYNKTPIETTAKIIYTARDEGIVPRHNPRADKWDVLQEAAQNRTIETRKFMNPKKEETETKAEGGE